MCLSTVLWHKLFPLPVSWRLRTHSENTSSVVGTRQFTGANVFYIRIIYGPFLWQILVEEPTVIAELVLVFGFLYSIVCMIDSWNPSPYVEWEQINYVVTNPKHFYLRTEVGRYSSRDRKRLDWAAHTQGDTHWVIHSLQAHCFIWKITKWLPLHLICY